VFTGRCRCGEYNPSEGPRIAGHNSKGRTSTLRVGIDVHPRVAEQATKRIEVGGILKVVVVSKINSEVIEASAAPSHCVGERSWASLNETAGLWAIQTWG
jgi:hypothetical protein